MTRETTADRSWQDRVRENGLLLACLGFFTVFFAGMVIGLPIFLRQRGSAESKPVAAPHRETSA